ncbi:hypothetical protein HHK36_002974 [Tetracentron sinense]|uniref:Uncharacterized protein n=1 Tax=Tetracentron sinense TaxID=13715 RepID=A0A834ZRI3_TETSI|nr:hypothetical protein HHK36_002974 [Tetracentron sinense]
MAEAVVSLLVERLRDLLIREAVLLSQVNDQVVWLRIELNWMQCFLKDADAKQEKDNRVRNWVSEITNVAYDAEDIIDTFILKVVTSTQRRGFKAKVWRYAFIFKKGIYLYKLGKDIEAIKSRILDISRRRETYGIKNIGGGEGTSSVSERLRNLRRSSPHGDEEHVVGYEEDTKTLVAQLIEGQARRCVISIVGMGGLGKTTLAKKVYNCSDVKRHFPCRAWVYISEEYRIKDVLQRIIKSYRSPTKEELERMEMATVEDLEQQIYQFLHQRQYLVVIDDIWHQEAWGSLRRVFPNSNNGSRILLTTRNKSVALCADDRSLPYELPFLKTEDSWELFCTKAFTGTTCCPPGLEKLGREMVVKCGGLPLAIIVLGGLLSRKNRSPHEWQRVLNHISQHLMKDQNHLSQILALSYNDLPYQLKSCFLYVGLFPEDFEIPREKLIRLWVAEGFIQQGDETEGSSIQQGDETMEDVAEDYLNELIDRSLIQVAKRSQDRIEECHVRVHDLLRDLAIKKANEVKFFSIYGNLSSPPPSAKSRRHAIHSEVESYVSLNCPRTGLRSLLLLNRTTLSIEQRKFIFRGFKLLRVLDLENTRFGDSIELEEVGKLIHLRYLGLKKTHIRKLPPSIGNLRNLQTLYVTGEYCTVPNEIRKMKELRHLLGWFNEPLRVDTLTNLQTLETICANDWMKNGSGNLINLRELRINRISGSYGKKFWEKITKLGRIRSLSLNANDGFPTLIPLSCCRHLIQLSLNGRMEKLPEHLHEFPANLTQLFLRNSQLEQDPMPILEKLPNLTVLRLEGSLTSQPCKEIICSPKGFPQLEVLELQRLEELKKCIVEDGAMPSLRVLKITRCNKMRTVPEGLMFVTTLRELCISDMGRAFEKRLQGEDSYKVSHIQSIVFN